MIPRSQHFRDHAPFPLSGWGVVGIFEQAAFERLLGPTGRRAHYAGKQPNASVEKHQRRRLAAREDDVADRGLLGGTRGEDPLVETLEAAAENGDAGADSELAYTSLR